MTPQERALMEQQYGQLGGMTGQLNQQYGQASQDYAQTAAQFRDALTRFATGSLEPTPEQLAQSTAFVDQTFTAPAEQQFGKFLDQAQEKTANRAAALGRTSLDSAINQQFVGQASEVAQQLANQRGSLIAQRADELAYARPQQQLNALGQGAQFFNQPLQNAINNRLSLLNAGTAQQQLGLERQLQTGSTMTSQGGTSTGTASKTEPGASLGTRLSGLGSQLSDLYKAGGFGSTDNNNLNVSSANPSLGNFNLNTGTTAKVGNYFTGFGV
jgi:hypothetical protein